MIDLDAVRAAQSATRRFLRRTPVEPSPALDGVTGATVVLKLESQQVTGSFKPRGPFNRLLAMTPEERGRGVVAATAGNHGVGLSYAGARLGVPCHVYIPRGADPDKLAMLAANGARIHFTDSFEQAHVQSVVAAEREGLTFVSAYNDPLVVASDGVVGLELMDDGPRLDLVIVPVGGGGLIAGIATAMKTRQPDLEIWGVEAANSPTFTTWTRQGRPGRVALTDSIAEGLAGYVEPETMTWPLIRDGVDRMTTATESELAAAMGWLVARHRLIVEPSGAAGVAAALAAGTALQGRRVGIIISGGNVAWSRFLGLIGQAHTAHQEVS